MKFWKKSISSQVKFTTGFRVFTFWEPIIFTTRDVSLWASAKCAVETRTDRLSQEGQREGQELDIRMCCHHIKSEPRTKTFMLHARPHPLCVAQWVKLPPHWRCDDPQKAILSGYLSPCSFAPFIQIQTLGFYIIASWHTFWQCPTSVYIYTLIPTIETGFLLSPGRLLSKHLSLQKSLTNIVQISILIQIVINPLLCGD